jgi:hypothetical protein
MMKGGSDTEPEMTSLRIKSLPFYGIVITNILTASPVVHFSRFSNKIPSWSLYITFTSSHRGLHIATSLVRISVNGLCGAIMKPQKQMVQDTHKSARSVSECCLKFRREPATSVPASLTGVRRQTAIRRVWCCHLTSESRTLLSNSANRQTSHILTVDGNAILFPFPYVPVATSRWILRPFICF